jgi:hypothetical protein
MKESKKLKKSKKSKKLRDISRGFKRVFRSPLRRLTVAETEAERPSRRLTGAETEAKRPSRQLTSDEINAKRDEIAAIINTNPYSLTTVLFNASIKEDDASICNFAQSKALENASKYNLYEFRAGWLKDDTDVENRLSAVCEKFNFDGYEQLVSALEQGTNLYEHRILSRVNEIPVSQGFCHTLFNEGLKATKAYNSARTNYGVPRGDEESSGSSIEQFYKGVIKQIVGFTLYHVPDRNRASILDALLVNDTIKDWSHPEDIKSVMDILVKEVESLPDDDGPQVPVTKKLTKVLIKELNRSYQYYNKDARDDKGKLKVSSDCHLIEKFPKIVQMRDLSLAKNEDKMLGEVFTESVQSIRGRQAQQPQRAVGDTTRERGGIHAKPTRPMIAPLNPSPGGTEEPDEPDEPPRPGGPGVS